MGYPFRSRLEHDPAGDVAVVQMKDIDDANPCREGGRATRKHKETARGRCSRQAQRGQAGGASTRIWSLQPFGQGCRITCSSTAFGDSVSRSKTAGFGR